jgi:hypothetical protein
MTRAGAPDGERRGPSIGDCIGYLLGVVGLSACITAVWLGMRAVMNIGGYCASGGPYVVATECPPGVDVLMIAAFPLGFLSAGVMVWKGARLGGRYVGLAALAWPALFLSLGWNFLEYAFRPPDDSGEIVWGWLIPGVIFVLMGGIPLLGWIGARGQGPVVPGVPATTTPIEVRELGRALRQVHRTASARAAGALTLGEAMDVGPPVTGATLTSELERLSALFSSGALTEAEYVEAKRAVIGAASRGNLG